MVSSVSSMTEPTKNGLLAICVRVLINFRFDVTVTGMVGRGQLAEFSSLWGLIEFLFRLSLKHMKNFRSPKDQCLAMLQKLRCRFEIILKTEKRMSQLVKRNVKKTILSHSRLLIQTTLKWLWRAWHPSCFHLHLQRGKSNWHSFNIKTSSVGSGWISCCVWNHVGENKFGVSSRWRGLVHQTMERGLPTSRKSVTDWRFIHQKWTSCLFYQFLWLYSEKHHPQQCPLALERISVLTEVRLLQDSKKVVLFWNINFLMKLAYNVLWYVTWRMFGLLFRKTTWDVM